MIRRSHKKSRNGCAECRGSHKKCDESRPACVNCTTAKKQCSYIRNATSQSPSDRDFVLFTGPDDVAGTRSPQPNIASRPSNPSPQTPTPTAPHTEAYINFLHLELFQNVTSRAISFPIDDPNKENQDEWVATVLRYTFSYPYLMYEVLAISAFHLSIMHPSNSDLYLTESATLQAQALSLFNSSTPTVNQGNLNAAFLFSGLLGLHFFCDTFSTASPDLDTFLDRLVQSLKLLRGVRALVGGSWEVIKNSDLKVLLQAEQDPGVNRNDEITHAFEELRINFSQVQSLSAFESSVYCEAITSLITVYNSRTPDSTTDGPIPDARTVMQWPITISAEYTELLNRRKPEALVVMAHFSILLYSRRAFWAVGNAGSYLLTAIEKYLGQDWAEWLAVPKKMVPPL